MYEIPRRIEKRCGCFLDEFPTVMHDAEVSVAGECLGCGAVWTSYDGRCPEVELKDIVRAADALGLRINFITQGQFMGTLNV